ncbi:R-directed D polymerase from mobile element jockey [Daphnia sinensis]|uniref:R-directed D polymerase from mobile element jockey n=1 Tax=Daphnia sinensis TaxID=1820382 RepID=A0AAD5LEK6_9CRUS|nr:R-directed D polymerase from mobile element jockey [Daphnia sinensis]
MEIRIREMKCKFNEIEDTKDAFQTFYEIALESSKKNFALQTEAKCTRHPNKPWWNNDCAKKVAEFRRAWKRYQEWPSTENRSAYNKANAIKKRTILQAQRSAWDTKLASIDIKDSKEAWIFVNAMRNLPVKSLDIKNFLMPDGTQKAMKKRIDQASKCEHSLDTEINITEIAEAIGQLKNTTMGDDLIHNEMLRNMNKDNLEAVTRLFNLSLTHSCVPPGWKTSTICPIRKPDKNPSDPESYRPIALTSCLRKLMERIISCRITWMLDKSNKLPSNQAGFRKGRSTLVTGPHYDSRSKKTKVGKELPKAKENTSPDRWREFRTTHPKCQSTARINIESRTFPYANVRLSAIIQKMHQPSLCRRHSYLLQNQEQPSRQNHHAASLGQNS